MRIQAVQNQQNNRITFQGVYTEASKVRDAILIADGKGSVPNPRKVRTIIRKLLELAKDSRIVGEARVEINTKKALRATTKAFKARHASAEAKRDAIRWLFRQTNSKTFDDAKVKTDYIDKKLIPHILKTRDKKLATFIVERIRNYPVGKTTEYMCSITERLSELVYSA